MKKIIYLTLILLTLFSLLIAVILKLNTNHYVLINGQKIFVDVAKTNVQKEKGLSVYNNLPMFRGMLFPFSSKATYQFWMKDMKFPIDIIYIDDNKIVDIFKNVPNPKTSSEKPAIIIPSKKSNYVLEINAGLSQKYNFKTGDTIQIKL